MRNSVDIDKMKRKRTCILSDVVFNFITEDNDVPRMQSDMDRVFYDFQLNRHRTMMPFMNGGGEGWR